MSSSFAQSPLIVRYACPTAISPIKTRAMDHSSSPSKVKWQSCGVNCFRAVRRSYFSKIVTGWSHQFLILECANNALRIAPGEHQSQSDTSRPPCVGPHEQFANCKIREQEDCARSALSPDAVAKSEHKHDINGCPRVNSSDRFPARQKWLRLFEQLSPIYKWALGGLQTVRSAPRIASQAACFNCGSAARYFSLGVSRSRLE